MHSLPLSLLSPEVVCLCCRRCHLRWSVVAAVAAAVSAVVAAVAAAVSAVAAAVSAVVAAVSAVAAAVSAVVAAVAAAVSAVSAVTGGGLSPLSLLSLPSPEGDRHCLCRHRRETATVTVAGGETATVTGGRPPPSPEGDRIPMIDLSLAPSGALSRNKSWVSAQTEELRVRD